MTKKLRPIKLLEAREVCEPPVLMFSKTRWNRLRMRRIQETSVIEVLMIFVDVESDSEMLDVVLFMMT
jgi:hypothetical protein